MPKAKPEAGITYVGCKEAKEISLTRAGANPHAHVLVRKNTAGAAQSTETPETTNMTDAEKAAAEAKATAKATAIAAKAILSMTEVAKAHYLTLDEDGQIAFLAKSVEDQTKEAEAAKTAKEAEAAKEAAKTAGMDDATKAVQKQLDEQASEIATLKAEKAERDLKDKAASADFAGYPGGQEKVLEVLKSIKDLPEAQQAPTIEAMKTAATAAKKLNGLSLGLNDTVDIAKSKPATAKIDEAAKSRATEKGITYHQAYRQLSEDPAFAADFAAAREEESAPVAA